MGAGTQRDRSSVDDASQSPPMYRATDYRQIRRCLLPTRTAYVEPADSRDCS